MGRQNHRHQPIKHQKNSSEKGGYSINPFKSVSSLVLHLSFKGAHIVIWNHLSISQQSSFELINHIKIIIMRGAIRFPFQKHVVVFISYLNTFIAELRGDERRMLWISIHRYGVNSIHKGRWGKEVCMEFEFCFRMLSRWSMLLTGKRIGPSARVILEMVGNTSHFDIVSSIYILRNFYEAARRWLSLFFLLMSSFLLCKSCDVNVVCRLLPSRIGCAWRFLYCDFIV